MPRLGQEQRDKGDVRFYTANNVLLISWKDKREVNMLTTVHEPKIVDSHSIDYQTKEYVKKPEAVLDYNINMRLVDKSDAMISSIECARKSMKWYRKLFFHLLDMTTHNAHILHREVTGKKETFEDFVLQLCREIMEQHHPEARKQSRKAGTRGRQTDNPARLTERHFAVFVPPTEKKQFPQRKCKVCMHTSLRPQMPRKETRYMCRDCGIALCFPQCFIDYHTLSVY